MYICNSVLEGRSRREHAQRLQSRRNDELEASELIHRTSFKRYVYMFDISEKRLSFYRIINPVSVSFEDQTSGGMERTPLRRRA